MTTSIFSKLSQQSKHRDLLEIVDPNAPPIGNPKTAKTIAEFRAMGLDVRMVCGSCGTSGPLDVSSLPRGIDTESRIAAARCPSCGSEAVSQEIVPLGSVSGPSFVGFVRIPRVASAKSYQRNRALRAEIEILPEDDLPADLLPILEKNIVEDQDFPEEVETKEDDEGNMNASAQKAPVKPSAKAPVKTSTPSVAKAQTKVPAKTSPKAASKALTKTVAKSTGKTTTKASAKTPPKAVVRTSVKTVAKGVGKTTAKASAKTSPKAASKALAKTVAKSTGKITSKAPAKTPPKAVARTPAKSGTKGAGKTTTKASAKSPKGRTR